MKYLLIGVTAAATIAFFGPAWAQALPPGTPAGAPAVTYPAPVRYPFPAPTPEDAYRQGLITRAQLEQYEGPTPQALQGPSVDGSKNSFK
jgi:hypothetical protein